MYLENNFKLYFDGCSKGNPGISGAGAVIYNNNEEIWSNYLFIGNNITNNVNYYYNLINYGIKGCFGYYVFSTFVNTLYNPFWFIRDITKKLICS